MILRLEDVCKNYKIGKTTIKIIKHISYEFESGKLYAITGDKYSGKTLLINLIGTLEQPTSGYLTVGSISYIKKKDKDISKIRNRYFGYILPYLKLDKTLSIEDNILIPCNNNIDINNLLERVGITKKRKLNINDLNKIDTFRIFLARSLINNPKILLIDEELDKLTKANQQQIIKTIKKLSKDMIVIISTNSKTILNEVDKIIKIKFGTIVKE